FDWSLEEPDDHAVGKLVGEELGGLHAQRLLLEPGPWREVKGLVLVRRAEIAGPGDAGHGPPGAAAGVCGDGGPDRGAGVARGGRDEDFVENSGLDDPPDAHAVRGDSTADTQAARSGDRPGPAGQMQYH